MSTTIEPLSLARSALLFFVSLLVGAVSALQNVINGRAGQQLGQQPVLGSGLSFVCGLLVLSALVSAASLSSWASRWSRKATILRSSPLSDLGVEIDMTEVPRTSGADSVVQSTTGSYPNECSPTAPPAKVARTTTLPTTDSSGSASPSGSVSEAEQTSSSRSIFCWSPLPAWFMLLPGVLGACIVTTSVAVTPVIGHALYSVAVVLGQLSVSSVIDACGVPFPGVETPRLALSRRKVVALAVVLIGCVLSVAENIQGSFGQEGADSGVVLAVCMIASTLVAGLLPIQAVLNRAASARLPSRLHAVWWSFFVGTLCLTAVAAIFSTMTSQGSLAASIAGTPWWMYAGALPRACIAHRSGCCRHAAPLLLGGPLGICFVGSAMLLVAAQGAEVAWHEQGTLPLLPLLGNSLSRLRRRIHDLCGLHFWAALFCSSC